MASGTTTSDATAAAQAPHLDNRALVANLVCRVLLASIGIVLCWVPFRLLHRNGEFAAVVLIVDVAVMNLFTVVNSLIWRSDDLASWWSGRGLCDLEVYLSAPLQTIYAASIFTVMHHLADRVKAPRVKPLDNREKTRKHLVQAAMIFPVPIVQLVFTWFDLAQRYVVGTLVGCSAVYDSSWPKAIVYDIPAAAFAILAVPFAFLTWRRFRAVAQKSQAASRSNRAVSSRATRARRRLYNMSLSILVVYLPIMVYYMVVNIRDTLASYKAYNYSQIHWSGTPYPWDAILFIPSSIVPSAVMNQPWVPISTTIAIVTFFGTGADAREMYRAGKTRSCEIVLDGNETQDSSSGSTKTTAKVANTNDCTRQDAILPTTRPDRHTTTYLEAQTTSALHTEQEQHIPLEASASGPAIPIPPRQSSLRQSFLFRRPTLPSFSLSMRLPSLPSAGRSRHTSGASGASVASNRATGGGRSGGDGDDDDDFELMLPLHTFPATERPSLSLRTASPVTVQTIQYAAPSQEMTGKFKKSGGLGGRGQVRIPILPH
ncbi:pheromone A receptor-domain-containing protein [Xylariaceae sp. FL0804]|nr:pheromone A receptor-domain-containing protein [Xylariaceae sp. FL0804]